MKREPVDWHWPRADLAQHYIRMFQVVGAHSMVLFAPRGKGKTQFMTRDVIPAATADGMFPVYINFWDDNNSPAHSMRYAMLRAADEAGVLQKMRAGLSRAKAEIKFGLNFGVTNLEIKPGIEKKELEESLLFNLREITDNLRKHSGRPLLLIFDEVQTLANRQEHESYVRSLRTLLDERRGHIYSIFTGSSQSKLTEMFARIKAPLYNFAQQQEFPPLGDPFLKHWLTNVQKIMGGAQGLTLDGMREAFVITERTPRVLWSAVLEMIQANSVDIVAHARRIAAQTSEHSGMRQRVEELTPLDRAVLIEVLEATIARREGAGGRHPQLFSAPVRERIRQSIGVTPTPSQVQGSLRRLTSPDVQIVVSKERGIYEIEDPFFLEWMREELLDQPASQEGDAQNEASARTREGLRN